MVLVLAAAATVAVGLGAVAVPPATVWWIAFDGLFRGVLTPDWDAGQAAIVWQLRVPRVLLGAVVGAALAMVGAALQASTRNPLADPHLFGISSGASLGAVVVLLHVGALIGPLSLPLAAFAGAALSMLMVTAVARRDGALAPDRLILGGVAVSFVLMAATNFLIFLGDHRAASAAVFRMLGGLGLARWDELWVPAVVPAGGGVRLMANARGLNALMAGEETAATLGIDVGRFRLALLGVRALLAGTMVAMSGAIGFVGLMMPHITRLLVGADNRRLLPVAGLAGAIFLVLVDIGARVVLAPEDLPIGIVTAALGGTFFLWQMRRR